MLGQLGDHWKDLYDHHMNILLSSKLYDEANFINIYVVGKNPLPFQLDKFNNVTYLGYMEDDTNSNKRLYRGDKIIFKDIWFFSQLYPDYKIFWYHSAGVSKSNPNEKKYKDAFRKYWETFNITYWKECVELLDYYDCVGTEYTPLASYKNHTIEFPAPHYQGCFWWANTNYLRRLDPFYFHMPVEVQQFLGEIWIGTGAPKAFSFYNTGLASQLMYTEVDYPYDKIITDARNHIDFLKKLKYQEKISNI